MAKAVKPGQITEETYKVAVAYSGARERAEATGRPTVLFF